MKYFVGIDVGGTKTKCVIADTDLNIINECVGKSSAFLIDGIDQMCNSLLNLLSDCIGKAELSFDDINAIVIGAAGAGRHHDAQRLEEALVAYSQVRDLNFPLLKVTSDALIALEGAFAGDPGAIIIAGTGSILFGKDPAGLIHRVGGCGRLIGDEGSGYSIGRKGLQQVAKYLDGRIAHTMLADILKEKFDITTQPELITKIYNEDFNIAAFAEEVIFAAEKEDMAAQLILEEEVNELVRHITTFGDKTGQVLPVSLVGGLMRNNIYTQMLKSRIKRVIPGIEIKNPDYPPALGAVIMAKKMIQTSSGTNE